MPIPTSKHARTIKANDRPMKEMTEGFHLPIDVLKLNDIDAIAGLPGIPARTSRPLAW